MLTILSVIIILAIIILYYTFANHSTIHVVSTFDGKVYSVLKDIHDPIESANVLAQLNQRILILKNHLQKEYPENIITKRLVKGYNAKLLSEAQIQSGYTTYTIDKSDIKVCLRTRDDYKKLYDINLLMYVLLHELAHVCNLTMGHDDNFKNVFEFLVQRALEINIYSYDDYRLNPKEYCGITLSSSII